MKLDQYIKLKKLTVTAFAEQAGLEVSVAWRAARGKHVPTPKTIQAITQATGGKVKPQDFYDVA